MTSVDSYNNNEEYRTGRWKKSFFMLDLMYNRISDIIIM